MPACPISTGLLSCLDPPQGGVLLPVLWNIVFDGLLKLFDTCPVKVIGYGDDAALVVARSDPFTLVALMQQALSKALQWSESVGLIFSREKTTAVVFTTKRDGSSRFPPLFFSGAPIEYCSSVKYLGIILDSKLTFKLHVKHKCKKATLLLFAFSKSIGRMWGPSQRAKEWTFTALVWLIVLFGSLVWAYRVGANF